MTTIHELLAEYTALAPDMRSKGLYFERLVQNFLTYDPLLQSRFDDVWLWNEWPNRTGADTGIDLVARERYTGKLCAIQCKFYADDHTVLKADIDSFFTASGKTGFDSRLIVTTTNKWSKNALDAITNQQIPTTKLGLDDLAESEIDWSTYSLIKGEQPELLAKKVPRDHQKAALADVLDGLDGGDRGQLIMACGTGKTFTSLKLAERVAPKGGSVLFLVPSIALLSQSLREWAAQADAPFRAFAICSDTRVGKDSEDMTLSDLSFPATTNAQKLVAQSHEGSNPDGLTVYFSTYQSIEVIHAAQEAGLAEFDLVICDEAHRTTGVTLSGDAKESHFVRVHDAQYIRASKRLYMTATPKIYGDAVKSKAKDETAELASMDDVTKFGPVLHRLGFGVAVEKGLLTDYRVLVLAVAEDAVASEFQAQFAGDDFTLNLNDAARIAGIYKALSKEGIEGLDAWKPSEHDPMRRAVAFSRSIKDSQHVSRLLDGNAALAESLAATDNPLIMRAQHVDGTMNIQKRTELLDWLKDPVDGNEVRILTNARCLSEGVDVPDLDAVIFLNSRDSQVDVVQSVGRVMRRAPGKEYGYIILPIAIEAGVEPEKALNNNAKYKVVWDVLRALRAHDERFEAKIESLDLNRTKHDDQIQVITVDKPSDSNGEDDEGGLTTSQPALSGISWGDSVREAVYAKLVKKVGERDYWENWASSVADVATAQTERVRGLVLTSRAVRKEFDRFVTGLQDNLNPSVTNDQALEMLAQHLITQPVLEALFGDVGFASRNPVAVAMNQMLTVLEGENLQTETKDLEGFYESVRTRVSQIKDARGKQDFLKLLYQRFFAVAMSKASERLGIVYTPTEIVDFILRSVDWVLRDKFDSSIGAEGVHVLDPFTGTGTFIAELIHSDLISDADLPRKYREELHANELNLLAYYVAAVNIEEAYQSRMGGNPVAFPGIVLTDTFQMTEENDKIDGTSVLAVNSASAQKQLATQMTVIVGNPPYSKGQKSGNDDNQNMSYPTLDDSIKLTYAARSTAQLKNSLYDAYIRSIRWASNQLATADRGVIGFVTNGGFIDGNTASGMRKVLAEEFGEVYIFNLRGNQRTAGEQSRREGGKVFGSGSRATIVVAILVKHPEATGGVHIHDVGDYLTREQKLAVLTKFGRITAVPWVDVPSNDNGDWIGQRSEQFERFRPFGSAVNTLSGALKSNRDPWVYGYGRGEVVARVTRMKREFNRQLDSAQSAKNAGAHWERENDASKISWSSGLIARLSRGRHLDENSTPTRIAMYRPYEKMFLSADVDVLERPAILSRYFQYQSVPGFAFLAPGESADFALIATDAVPDLHLIGSAQFVPRYTYEKRTSGENQLAGFDDDEPEYTCVDNVTDAILADYRATYGADVTKDDIFDYLYGLLHSPEYRERFAADLKKMLPRIPKVKDFWAFASAGKKLSALHLGYEQIDPWPLEEVLDGQIVPFGSTSGDALSDGDPLRVAKMRYPSKTDKSAVIVNGRLTLQGIPLEAHEYMLGSRSAIDWILERYQVKTDKASGIVNDANLWGVEHGDPRYIVDLLARITRVSIETVSIVNALPPLEILEKQ
ncbi:MAG: DEAD/DEAH box helicase [Rhodoglobus sp.]